MIANVILDRYCSGCGNCKVICPVAVGKREENGNLVEESVLTIKSGEAKF